jgi:hypothetical protein
MREEHLCKWLLQAVFDGVFDPNLCFSLIKLGFVCVDVSILKTMGTGAVLTKTGF